MARILDEVSGSPCMAWRRSGSGWVILESLRPSSCSCSSDGNVLTMDWDSRLDASVMLYSVILLENLTSRLDELLVFVVFSECSLAAENLLLE